MRAAALHPSLAAAAAAGSSYCCLPYSAAASAAHSHVLLSIPRATAAAVASQKNSSMTALVASTPSLSTLLPFAGATSAARTNTRSKATSAIGISQYVSTGIERYAPRVLGFDEAALGGAAAVTEGRSGYRSAVGVQRVAAAATGTCRPPACAALSVCCSASCCCSRSRNCLAERHSSSSSNSCCLCSRWLSSNSSNSPNKDCRWRIRRGYLFHTTISRHPVYTDKRSNSRREPSNCCCSSTSCRPRKSSSSSSNCCCLPESDSCMSNLWGHTNSKRKKRSSCYSYWDDKSTYPSRWGTHSVCRRRKRSNYESVRWCMHVSSCCCKSSPNRLNRGCFPLYSVSDGSTAVGSSSLERSDVISIDTESISDSTQRKSSDDSRIGSASRLIPGSSNAVCMDSRSAAARSSSNSAGVNSAEHMSSNRRNFSSSSSSTRSAFNSEFIDDRIYEMQQQQQRTHIRLPPASLLRSPNQQIRPLQVVLVGRPNVGKSTLFNRLVSGTRPCSNSRRRRTRSSGAAAAAVSAAMLETDCHLRRDQLLQQAIVSPQAGTTRDRRIARAVFGGLELLLVDTGGLEDKDITQASELLINMRKQVRLALRDADCVLFVVDATEGITPVDILLSRLLREWLEEDEQQNLLLLEQQQRQGSSSGCPESTAATADLMVRAAEKSVGGRPAMQQHHSAGRRRLRVLPSPTDSSAAAGHHRQAASFIGATTGGKTRHAVTADEAAAREITAGGRVSSSMTSAARKAVADASGAAAGSEAASGTDAFGGAAGTKPLEGDLSQDSSVPVILVANKADGCFLGAYLSDCYDLDLGSPVIVSAKKNEGFDDLYDRLVLEIGHRQQTLEAVWKQQAAEDEDLEDHVEAVSTFSGNETSETDEIKQEETARAIAEEQDKYICERVLRPPQPSGEAATWLEGLVRRYSRCGLNESYKQLCDPTSSMHLPWDLSRTSLAAAVDSEAPAVSSDASEAASSNGSLSAQPTSAAASYSHHAEKVAAAAAEWQQASAGVMLPVEEETVSLRIRRNKLKTKEGRDRFLSLKRQLLFDETIYLAVIGRPNVGKSTLVNALLGQERMIVSDEPGTTTDSVASDWEYKRHPFCLIDTSGVTRGWKMKHTDLLLEAGMQTLRNVRRSQVCILCVDGCAAESSGVPVSAHELALAHLATSKEGRCLVVCITKWDLVSEQQRERTRTEILERLQTGLGHVKGCPIVFTAAKHGHNLDTLMNRVLLLYRRWNARIPTSKLNAWLQQFLLHFPPPWRLGSRCQIKYLTQVKARPPTFVAWSNVYSAFPVNYQRQLLNAMREEFSLGGTPIRFILRTTANLPTGKRLSKKELLKWRRKTHRTPATSKKGSRKADHESEMSDSADAAAVSP